MLDIPYVNSFLQDLSHRPLGGPVENLVEAVEGLQALALEIFRTPFPPRFLQVLSLPIRQKKLSVPLSGKISAPGVQTDAGGGFRTGGAQRIRVFSWVGVDWESSVEKYWARMPAATSARLPPEEPCSATR